MKSKVLTVSCLLAIASVGCDGGAMAGESDASAPYSNVAVFGESATLRIDWKGVGRDADSGLALDVSDRDLRRKAFVHVNTRKRSVGPWRSQLDLLLKTRGVEPEWLHTERVEGAKLIRAYFPRDRFPEYYFKYGMPLKGRGPNLDVAFYVAMCHQPFAFENGAIHCSTQIDVDSHHVEIKFDRAFLWDFDRLSAEAIAAARYYLAEAGSRR